MFAATGKPCLPGRVEQRQLVWLITKRLEVRVFPLQPSRSPQPSQPKCGSRGAAQINSRRKGRQEEAPVAMTATSGVIRGKGTASVTKRVAPSVPQPLSSEFVCSRYLKTDLHMAVWWNWQTQGTCESPSGSLKGQHFPFAPKIPRSKQPCEFESRYRHQYIIT